MSMFTEQMTPEKADWNARCFVNGLRKCSATGKMEPASGEFSPLLQRHPWVRESIIEGWGKELRGHLILTVKLRIMAGKPHTDIDGLMPPKEWIAYAKQQAERYRKAAEWRNQHAPGGDMSGWLSKLLEGNRRRDEGEAA